MKRILVLGATSAIARACCRRWLEVAAQEGADPVHFHLVARAPEPLEQTASDLRARGAISVTTHCADLADPAGHPALVQAALRDLGELDRVLIAHGTLPDHAACERDPELALREFAVNGTSVIALLLHLANVMTDQGRGTLAVITSVAGDRGRPSNYVYGSAKAAVSTCCEGLRARLFRAGVHLIDIRPGFVDTPMTAGLNLPRALVATPEQVARRIVRGIERRRDVLYVPPFWALILWVIRVLPRPLFKRLSL